MNEDNKVDGFSFNPQHDLVEFLKEKAPEVFTEGKIDADKLNATLGNVVSVGSEKYGLNWAGKSDCFAEIQKTTTNTLKPLKDKSIRFDETENIFIEGENLEVLKILQRSYFNKVKMIYIDPPYNTGSDSFIYDDKFKSSKEYYEKEAGVRDGNGDLNKDSLFRKNTADSGRYHSNWLNMMYPRLFLARNLLREDGVIFVSIDGYEMHNLRLLLDEIFGEENKVGEFIWKSKHGGGGDNPFMVQEHEYILFYAKNINALEPLFVTPPDKYFDMFRYEDSKGKYYLDRLDKKGIDQNRPNLIYPIKCPDGTTKDISPQIWRLSEEEFNKRKSEGLVEFKKDKNGEWQIYTKTYLRDEDGNKRRVKPRSVLKQEIVGFTQNGNKEMVEIFGTKLFDNPKPVSLIKFFSDIALYDHKDALTLDFFAGSGTTAQAVMELNKEDGGNRKFILVQLPELTEEKSEAYKAGYKNIADITLARIQKVSEKLSREGTKTDLGVKTYKLDKSNFKIWQSDKIKDAKDLQQQMLSFTDIIQPHSTKESMLYEIMLKSGYPLTSKVENKGKYYSIDSNAAVICLEEKTNGDIVEDVLNLQPQLFICLDSGFSRNDQLKTNAKLQFKDKGIEFKVI
ncbi:MAG: site-specific DNA-methyltransferase [Patescibacteria group bacterium]